MNDEAPIADLLAANVARIRARIDAACARCGRDAATVRPVIATKYADARWIPPLVVTGIRDVGESRPQQLIARARHWPPDLPAPRWHLIGHLQRNKVRAVLPHARLIHSVDSFRLLESIDRVAGEDQLDPAVLLEVNVSGESAKDGFDPAELRAGCQALRGLRHVRVEGVMTMAPYSDDPEDSRGVFRRLRLLRDELAQALAPGPALPELSMGMSTDFEVAIEEGATIVRIGSAAFEGLPQPHG